MPSSLILWYYSFRWTVARDNINEMTKTALLWLKMRIRMALMRD